MAAFLSIVREDQLVIFNLLTGAYNVSTQTDLVVTLVGRTTTRNQQGLWEERFFLVGQHKGSGHDDVVNGAAILGGIGERTRDYHRDRNEAQGFWLKERAEGETAIRAGFMFDLEIRPIDEGDFSRLQVLGLTNFELVVMRGEWENDFSGGEELPTVTGSDVPAGGKIVLPAGGTLPGRVLRLLLTPGASIGTGAASRAVHYVGIRPFYLGVADFVSELDWTQGTMGADASVVSTTVQINFSTVQTMVPRVTLKLSDVAPAANFDHFMGDYTLVMSYSTTGGAPLRYAMMVTGDGVESEAFYGVSTASLAAVVEMGTIRIPSQAKRNTGVGLGDIEIVLWAELIASTTTITIDKIYLVPSRHMARFEGILHSGAPSGYIELRVMPDGNPLLVSSDGTEEAFGAPEMTNLVVPKEGGALVYVGTNLDGGLGGGVDIEMYLREHWEGYRND